MDERAINAVLEILKRGNDALIKRKGNGYIILEVKRTTKYSASN